MSRPDILYYNCDAPHRILKDKVILPSPRVQPGVGGVSMSVWKEMGSHGPFKIAFCRAPWFDQFHPVQYGPNFGGKADIAHRHEMFKDEQEWWSREKVRFLMRDVLYVAFMLNAPNPVLTSRNLAQIKLELKANWGSRYTEEHVHDPYLERAVCK